MTFFYGNASGLPLSEASYGSTWTPAKVPGAVVQVDPARDYDPSTGTIANGVQGGPSFTLNGGGAPPPLSPMGQTEGIAMDGAAYFTSQIPLSPIWWVFISIKQEPTFDPVTPNAVRYFSGAPLAGPYQELKGVAIRNNSTSTASRVFRISNGASRQVSGACLPGASNVFSCRYSPTATSPNGAIYIDGAEAIDGTTGNATGNNDPQGVSIGGSIPDAQNYTAPMRAGSILGGFVIIQGNVSISDRQAIEQYLMGLYL